MNNTSLFIINIQHNNLHHHFNSSFLLLLIPLSFLLKKFHIFFTIFPLLPHNNTLLQFLIPQIHLSHLLLPHLLQIFLPPTILLLLILIHLFTPLMLLISVLFLIERVLELQPLLLISLIMFVILHGVLLFPMIPYLPLTHMLFLPLKIWLNPIPILKLRLIIYG